MLALLLVPPLRWLGIGGAGHVAIRILAGLGGAWLLLQICAEAGRDRVRAGAAFALPLLASRGFLVEAAAGETILPGAASALFALRVASRPGSRLLGAAAALTFAVLIRQDNVLVTPGVAAGLWIARARGARAGAIAKVVGGAGLATLAGYVAAWLYAMRGAISFPAWVTWMAHRGPWTGPAQFEWSSFGTYFSSLAAAMTGAFWSPEERHPWLGVALVAPFAAAGLMLRGTAPRLERLLPVGLTLAGWAFVHAWFEASNFEWLVSSTGLLAAASAGLAHGMPATSVFWRRTGAALLLALAALLLATHGPWTWRLRERRFAEAVAEARSLDPGNARMIAVGHRPMLALALHDVDSALIAVAPGLDEIFRQIEATLRSTNGPAILVFDRFVGDGMPRTMFSDRRSAVDDMPAPPGARFLRREGLVYGIFFDPAGARPDSGASSRPASR